MGLTHWWPLIDDLLDRISGKNLEGLATLSESIGKIGKSFEITNPLLSSFTLGDCFDLNRGFSISCWIYVDYNAILSIFNSENITIDIEATGTILGYSNSIALGWLKPINQSDILIKGIIQGSSCLLESAYYKLEDKKWTHITVIFDPTVKTLDLWVNSNYITPTNTSEMLHVAEFLNAHVNFGIGRNGFWGGNRIKSLPMFLNDVRIYDHPLCVLEIKELKKAQIIHYTFDDLLCEPTENKSQQNFSDWKVFTDYLQIKLVNDSGWTLLKQLGYDQNTVAIYNNYLRDLMNPGETWSISCFLYKNGNPYITSQDKFFFSNNDLTVDLKSSIKKENGYFCNTFTINSIDKSKNLYLIHNALFDECISTDFYEIRHLLLEKKEFATPYTRGSRTSKLYNESSLELPTTRQDIQLTLDSAVGDYSLNCAGNTLIETPTYGIASEATASFWIKTESYPGTTLIIFTDTVSKLGFGFYDNLIILSCNDYAHSYLTGLDQKWVNNKWLHIVLTKNAEGKITCYLNTENLDDLMHSTDTNYWTTTNSGCTIGGRKNGTYTNYCTCMIDDFRLYNTALNSYDIKNLYETKMFFSNKKDIVCNSFVENNRCQITKTGVIALDEFCEESILPQIYTELEYIESDAINKLYIDTGYIARSNDYTYELAIESAYSEYNLSSLMGFINSTSANKNPRAAVFAYMRLLGFGANATCVSDKSFLQIKGVIKARFKSGGTGRDYINGQLTLQFKNIGDPDSSYLSLNCRDINKEEAGSGTEIKKEFNHTNNSLSTYIFARNDMRSASAFMPMKLYWAKIYENNRCIREYIPVIRNLDNKPCLYETVTKTFLTNKGGGEFSHNLIEDVADTKSTITIINDTLNDNNKTLMKCHQLIEN